MIDGRSIGAATGDHIDVQRLCSTGSNPPWLLSSGELALSLTCLAFAKAAEWSWP